MSLPTWRHRCWVFTIFPGNSRFYHLEFISFIVSITWSSENSIQQSQYEFEKTHLVFKINKSVSPHIVHIWFRMGNSQGDSTLIHPQDFTVNWDSKTSEYISWDSAEGKFVWPGGGDLPFGRGPTTRTLGDENDHHGYYPLQILKKQLSGTACFSEDTVQNWGLYYGYEAWEVCVYIYISRKRYQSAMRDLYLYLVNGSSFTNLEDTETAEM